MTSSPKRAQTEIFEKEPKNDTDIENLLKQHTKIKMRCDANYVEIESQDEWNVLLEWLKKNDATMYDKMTHSLTKSDQEQLDELNRKQPNTRPTDVNPIYIAKIKVNGHRYFMLDDHAKRYAFVIDKKLKFFHIKTEEHGFIFVTLKVDITPMERAVIDWYFNHVYEEHFRIPLGIGRKMTYLAMFYQFEEFSSRPRHAELDTMRIHCKNVSDNNSCLANIEYCVCGGELKFHFNPHSALERHRHSLNSDWSYSEDDSEPEPEEKPKAKPFTASRVKVTDADFTADAAYGMSNRNKRNLVQPGTAYKYFKGKPHPSTGSYVWQCAQQNKTIGRCNARALVKTINKKEKVAFVGTHNH